MSYPFLLALLACTTLPFAFARLARTMGFIQPPVRSLPPGIDLSEKTAIVTGASSGLGLETARQLLTHKLSTLILAVRNTAKGEAVRQQLLSDPHIQASNPDTVIKVMELDLDRYASVHAFADAVEAEVPVVDVLVLNAGLMMLEREISGHGHERTVQVNYLSNVLLMFRLLPHLEAGAKKTGSPARVTWVGSRNHHMSTVGKKLNACRDGGVFEYLDDKRSFFGPTRYGDSKLLCALFLYEMAKRMDPALVEFNQVCPGMVYTSIDAGLPWYLKGPVDLVKKMRARPVEHGGWIIMNAAVVAGRESHGRFLLDNEVEEMDKFIASPAGRGLQGKLWIETIDEMSGQMDLPSAVTQKA